MPDLITRLRLDSSQYNSGIDSAKQKTHELQDTADDASKSLKDMGDKGAKSAKDLLKEMSNLENAGRSASNYRRQLGQIQKSIVDLTVGYRNMSKEMQQSPLGQEVAAKIQELTQKASEYKDAIGDVQQEIQKMASDTAVWDGMKMGIETVSSSLQAFVSTGVLGEKTTEQLVDVLAKLKAIETGTNAVIKIGNALQKQSALMTSIATLQTKAATKAKLLEAAATGKATIAQRLFNVVAKANPYVLLATAVITVVSALAAFSLGTDKAKKKQEELNAAHEEYMSNMSDSISKMGDAAYNFDTLAKKYKECRTAAEKQKFMVDYKDKLNDLGISINNINDLENVFVKKTDDFRKACVIRAQAMGLESMQADNYKDMMSDLMKVQDLLSKQSGTRVDEKTPLFDILKKFNVYGKYDAKSKTGLVERLGKDYFVIGPNVAKDAEKAIRDYYSNTSQTIADEQKKLENQVQALDLGNTFNFSGKGNTGGNSNTSGNGNKGGNNKPEIQALEGSKKAVQDLISKTQALRDAQVVGTDEWNKQNDALKELNNQLDEILGKEKRLKNPPIKLEPVKVNFELPNKVEPMQVPVEVKRDKLVESYKKAGEDLSRIQGWLNIGAISQREAQALVDQLNKDLTKKGIKADLKLDLDVEITPESYSKAAEQMDAFVSKMDQLGSVGNAVSSINSVYEAISGLGEKLSEAQNGWEAFFAIFQTGMTIFNAVATIIETVATVTELLTAAKIANTAATTANTTAATADAAAQTTDAGATASNAALHGAAAAAKGGEAVSSIPYVGPVLAVIAVASIMAAIIAALSQAKGFATGGIVDAPSKIGDKNFIRVNGGEAVLNERQQANLFKMLDEGRVERHSNLGGEVEFKIRGTELVGVLNNINRKNSKI